MNSADTLPTPTEPQRRAVEAPLGPVLVIAGPGAGKTFCLIGRIEHLLQVHRAAPDRICAVTFTNKAAEEIAARLHRSIGHRAEDVTRGTLHSLCLSILRQYGERIGLARGFGVADDEYQRALLARLGVPIRDRKVVLEDFGRHRLQGHRLAPDRERLHAKYARALRERNLVDFDDLIALVAELFRRNPDIAAEVAGRWDHLLVDEFQDLNDAQYQILQQLARPHQRFFAVGDDEQSIFSWTGADPAILLRFKRDYQVPELVLDENRRCARQIFESARRLLSGNPRLFEKQLRSSRETTFPVRAVRFPEEEAEAAWVVADLVADRAEHRLGWGDYAVLYRRHGTGAHLESTLVRHGVPCRMARGRSLRDDPIVGYVVASLRLMAAPGDAAAVEAFASLVLPSELLERVRADAGAGGAGFLDALRWFAHARPREDPDRKKAWRFIYHAENLAAIRRTQNTLEGIVEELLSQRVGPYRNRMEDRHDELSDPADHPQAVALAEQIAQRGAREVSVPVTGGLGIALRGMLRAAGIPVTADGSGVPLTVSTTSDLGAPVVLFKALQLVHGRDFNEGLPRFVTFDLETTGKDPRTCEIIEIGAARVVNGRVVDRFQSLVRSAAPVSAGARAVHGYSDDALADAPPFEEVWPRFLAFVGDDTLVAHNGQKFDVPVLRRAAATLPGVDRLVFLDTFPLARSLFRESASLAALAERFRIEAGRSHHAQDDAVTLAQVFQELCRRKVVRARKTALSGVLDYLGLAMALDQPRPGAEYQLLREMAEVYALGRFSDCLEYYAAERDREPQGAPTVDQVIEKLGGAGKMGRIRARKTALQRYPEAMSRLQRLLEASRADTVEESLTRFLERVVLSSSTVGEADPHRVNLLTLHSTKGLEFSRVYILGVEDGQLPGARALELNQKTEIEEHRRLLYVGMTRAKDRLILTRVDARNGRPAGKNRFLDEMGLVVERGEEGRGKREE